jgi:type IV pilus assembly protein PilB
MADRLRLGELLVEAGLVSSEALEAALEKQKTEGRRLGELLVEAGALSEVRLTQVLSQQLSVPWVSLSHIDFSRQLLNLVPAETAQKYSVVPIYVRRAKNRQQTLYVAMVDPSDQAALDEIANFSGLPVRPMIAPASDILGAIRVYYLGLPAQSEPVPESVEAESVELPDPRASDPPPQMVTLTLLDGTVVKLPALEKGPLSNREPQKLTARDLIDALRVRAHGGDASQVVDDSINWELMFTSLLSILIKKRLIHDWEFVDEMKKL